MRRYPLILALGLASWTMGCGDDFDGTAGAGGNGQGGEGADATGGTDGAGGTGGAGGAGGTGGTGDGGGAACLTCAEGLVQGGGPMPICDGDSHQAFVALAECLCGGASPCPDCEEGFCNGEPMSTTCEACAGTMCSTQSANCLAN